MHKLVRKVRFSVNPFLPEDSGGFNSFASKPCGEGLSFFFELIVRLTGEVEPTTGFVVNVVDIDKAVREYAVPIFARRIREDFRRGKHIGFFEISEVLKSAWGQLADKFGKAKLSELGLALNPFRKVAADCEAVLEGFKMIYFSEKFEFPAMHKLWSDEFSEQRNFEIFGKCANPSGHGHNYIVEVTVKIPTGGEKFRIGDFEKVVDEEFIKLVDHKDLNTDVAKLRKINPTVENLAVFAWGRLAGKFGEAALHCVTIWETDRTYCSYYGE